VSCDAIEGPGLKGTDELELKTGLLPVSAAAADTPLHGDDGARWATRQSSRGRRRHCCCRCSISSYELGTLTSQAQAAAARAPGLDLFFHDAIYRFHQ